MKERTQTSTEMGSSWAATNHLSGRGLCSHCRMRQGGVPEGAVH